MCLVCNWELSAVSLKWGEKGHLSSPDKSSAFAALPRVNPALKCYPLVAMPFRSWRAARLLAALPGLSLVVYFVIPGFCLVKWKRTSVLAVGKMGVLFAGGSGVMVAACGS